MLRKIKGFLFIALTCFSANLFAQSGKTIVMAADEWCPYTCDPKTSPVPGYLVDITNAIFEAKGYSIDFQLVSWSHAIDEARKGVYQGLIGAYQADVPDFVIPKAAVGSSMNAFFTRKENPWTFTGIKSLERADIGVISGYNYGDEPFNEYIKKEKGTQKVQVIVGANPLQKNLRKVYMGWIDATLDDVAVVNFTLKKLGYTQNFKQAGFVGKPVPVFVVFSPNLPHSKEYAKIFSDGVEELRKSGQLQKILSSYGIADWTATPTAKQ